MRRIGFIAGALLLASVALSAQDNGSAAPQTPPSAKDENSRLTLKVLAGEGNKPVADAHVVVRFMTKRKLLKNKTTSWETKTNKEGEAVLPEIPYGDIRVQVIAKGFQTYGADQTLDNPEATVTIHLNPPQGQVSSY